MELFSIRIQRTFQLVSTPYPWNLQNIRWVAEWERMSTEYWQCYPAEEVHLHYPVPVFSKFACRWENDSWVTRRDVKGTWGSVQEYNFRQLRWCRVSLSELWGFQRGYRVSLYRNRKSVKNQRANQLMSRSLVLRLLLCVNGVKSNKYVISFFIFACFIVTNMLLL